MARVDDLADYSYCSYERFTYVFPFALTIINRSLWLIFVQASFFGYSSKKIIDFLCVKGPVHSPIIRGIGNDQIIQDFFQKENRYFLRTVS